MGGLVNAPHGRHRPSNMQHPMLDARQPATELSLHRLLAPPGGFTAVKS